MKETLSVSVIVITKNRPSDVETLLDALGKQVYLPMEILIVDASDNEQVALVTERYQASNSSVPARHIDTSPEYRQKTLQRNLGAGETKGDVIAFLDDDTVPEPCYLLEVTQCFQRHPTAVGVAGYVELVRHPNAASGRWFDNGLTWRTEPDDYRESLREYRGGQWVCREFERTTVLKVTGILGNGEPGWPSPRGFGREFYYVPPDGMDHQVELCSGAAMNWRREVFKTCMFSPYFTGHAPFEEFDFCFQALRHGEIFMATRARVIHKYSPTERPSMWHYGYSWSRNAWFAWRRRWPDSSLGDRMLWWVSNLALALFRFGDMVRWRWPAAAFQEGVARTVGLMSIIVTPPDVPTYDTDAMDRTKR